MGQSVGQIKTEEEEKPAAKKRRGAARSQKSNKEVLKKECENETKGQHFYQF